MRYLRGWSVLKQDPDWRRKIGVLALALLSTLVIPLAGQILVQGWFALLLRQVVQGREAPLPRIDFDFNYLGKVLGAGFKPFIVGFLWAMPVAVIAAIYVVLGYAVIIMAAVAGDEESLVLAAACFGVGLLLLIPILVVCQLPAAVAGLKAELADDLSAGLRLDEVLAFTRANLGVLFRGALVFTGVGLVFGAVGLLFCYVGVFPVAVTIGALWNVFLADVYRRPSRTRRRSLGATAHRARRGESAGALCRVDRAAGGKSNAGGRR